MNASSFLSMLATTNVFAIITKSVRLGISLLANNHNVHSVNSKLNLQRLCCISH